CAWNGKRRLSGVPHLFSNQKGTITENQFSLTFWTAPFDIPYSVSFIEVMIRFSTLYLYDR
ncbi:hypothetical protein, partial [Sporosarcina sp. USHLN248]|uniref:hypothetical protein n=1 Tax=Sporosarcina sp. USHLN248 TaxID=3081300 RepID=UPI00301897B3